MKDSLASSCRVTQAWLKEPDKHFFPCLKGLFSLGEESGKAGSYLCCKLKHSRSSIANRPIRDQQPTIGSCSRQATIQKALRQQHTLATRAPHTGQVCTLKIPMSQHHRHLPCVALSCQMCPRPSEMASGLRKSRGWSTRAWFFQCTNRLPF